MFKKIKTLIGIRRYFDWGGGGGGGGWSHINMIKNGKSGVYILQISIFLLHEPCYFYHAFLVEASVISNIHIKRDVWEALSQFDG